MGKISRNFWVQVYIHNIETRIHIFFTWKGKHIFADFDRVYNELQM